MFNRALFRLMIVLSVCATASLTSAQEGDLTDTVVQGYLEEEDRDTITTNGTITLNETVTANDTASMTVVASSMTVVPVVEDLYVDLTEEGIVCNDDHLVCEYMMDGRYEEGEFPAMVMVQFNTSGLEMQEDGVGVLVLKAESIEKVGDDMAAIALMPITSEWSENSSAGALALNVLSIAFMMSNGIDLYLCQFGVNFGGDDIFAFDVSEHLKAVEDGRVSFLLMAVGDTDYRVSFKSRETGEGPSLLITPYPSVPAT